jgi:hypothetical protein
MSTRFSITLLLCGLVGSVLFGVGAVMVLSIPSLSAHASVLLPVVIVASFIFAPAIGWRLAPMVRAKYVRREEMKRVRMEQAARPPT